MLRNVQPSIRLGLVSLASIAVCVNAAAGVASPEPGTITPDEFRTGEDIFRIRFGDPDKSYTGPLALCQVCGKPLKDHMDGFVCRSPNQSATDIETRNAVCPICGHTFKAFMPDAKSRGHSDSDFCRHPIGSGWMASEVWLCAKCGYANLYWDFPKPVAQDILKLMAEKITPNTKQLFAGMVGLKPKDFKFEDFSFLDQPSIPEFVKYENALAIAQVGGATSYNLAKLHLGSAHSYRRMLNKPVSAMGLHKAIRRVDALMLDRLAVARDPIDLIGAYKNTLARDKAKDALEGERLSSLEKMSIYIRLAGLHSRLGEGWWSEHYLKMCHDIATAQENMRVRVSLTRLVEERRGQLSREVRHMARAIQEHRKALEEGQVKREELVATVYLVGELLARVGDPAKALPWLRWARRLASTENEEPGRTAKPLSLISSWARQRLYSPLFYKTADDGSSERIPSNEGEEEFVARMLSQKTDGAEESAADPAPETTEASPPQDAAAPDVSGASTCAETMKRAWSTIEEYRRTHHGSYPPDKEALLKTGGAALTLLCPETGRMLYYRNPPKGSKKTFTVFHADPNACACKLMLMSDGTIEEFGK